MDEEKEGDEEEEFSDSPLSSRHWLLTSSLAPNQLVKDYNIELTWSEDNRWWVADIPDIPFCAADGPTPENALAALDETFEVLQEVYKEDDESFPEPKKPPSLLGGSF